MKPHFSGVLKPPPPKKKIKKVSMWATPAIVV